jgi:acyl-coenzyme A thioesterase 13
MPSEAVDLKARLLAYGDKYKASIPPDNFDHGLWKTIEVLSAILDPGGRTGKTTFAATLPKQYSNSRGQAHGGAIALLFDGLSSATLGLIAQKGMWVGSEATRSLIVKYLQPVKEGERVLVECDIAHAGRRLATVKAMMLREADGKLLAMCFHDKYNPESGVVAKL